MRQRPPNVVDGVTQVFHEARPKARVDEDVAMVLRDHRHPFGMRKQLLHTRRATGHSYRCKLRHRRDCEPRDAHDRRQVIPQQGVTFFVLGARESLGNEWTGVLGLYVA
jgi:hypothetical protein